MTTKQKRRKKGMEKFQLGKKYNIESGGADYTNTHKPKKRGNPAIQVEDLRDEQTPSAGRAKHNIGGRANLLEEMGRIDARKHPDAADRSEKRRVIGELNKGYKSGGAVLKGKKVGCQIK